MDQCWSHVWKYMDTNMYNDYVWVPSSFSHFWIFIVVHNHQRPSYVLSLCINPKSFVSMCICVFFLWLKKFMLLKLWAKLMKMHQLPFICSPPYLRCLECESTTFTISYQCVKCWCCATCNYTSSNYMVFLFPSDNLLVDLANPQMLWHIICRSKQTTINILIQISIIFPMA